jgi:hypothetical protein
MRLSRSGVSFRATYARMPSTQCNDRCSYTSFPNRVWLLVKKLTVHLNTLGLSLIQQ